MIQRKTLFLGGLAVIVLGGLVVQQTGLLRERFGPDNPPPHTALAAEGERPAGRTDTVRLTRVPIRRGAVGTIAARSPAAVSAQVMATVASIEPEVGSLVAAGDLIATLDDRELRARVAGAESSIAAAQAAVAGAEARAAQARAEWTRASTERDRTRRLHEREAATTRQLEAAVAADEAAAAAVRAADSAVDAAAAARVAAQERLNEARVQLDHTRVVAPRGGVVAAREVEPGELAMPGRPLVRLYDPGDLRIEAAVPAADAAGLAVGDEVRVIVPAAALEVSARIEEIQPVADPGSRSVLVKAPLAGAPALRPGHFARLEYAAGTREVLVVAAACVRRLGQVESVRVVREDGTTVTRHVRTRRLAADDVVEVLTGLAAGEKVALEGP